MSDRSDSYATTEQPSVWLLKVYIEVVLICGALELLQQFSSACENSCVNLPKGTVHDVSWKPVPLI